MSNTLLQVAVKASIPIITIQHLDILNIKLVLSEILDHPVGAYPLGNEFDPSKATLNKGKLTEFSIFYSTNLDFKCNDNLYNWLVKNNKTLILVNTTDTSYSFDAGAISIPSSYFKKLLKDFLDLETIENITPIISGLTIKNITELLRITTAKDGIVSPRTVTNNRNLVMQGATGLNKVDTLIPIYFPNHELKKYIDVNKPYFNNTTPAALVPRGVLLSGQAGVGKTLFAKHIANEFEVPLFRLDLSASLSRYVGSSERNLANILSAIEQETACIFLLDEAEKLFGEGEDSGVTSRLLAQLLWFLQEHKSRIFTVITTNDMSKLPPELYRPGRIDTVFKLEPLQWEDALSLALKVSDQFFKVNDAQFNEIRENIMKMEILTPANVTNLVYSLIKTNFWLK